MLFLTLRIIKINNNHILMMLLLCNKNNKTLMINPINMFTIKSNNNNFIKRNSKT